FLSHLLDTSGFTPRAQSGGWSPGLVWLHNLSDIMIWLAYVAIPVVLFYFVRRRRDLPFPAIFWLFGAFILCSGLTHFMEVVTSSKPMYRLSGLIKSATAVASWATVLALVPVTPKALRLRSHEELEREIVERKAAEQEVLRLNAGMRQWVQEVEEAN